MSASASSADRIALLNLQRHFVGAAVLRPLQRADRAGNAGVEIRAGAGNHPRREGGCIELVLRIENQRGLHGARSTPRWAASPCSRCRKCAAMRVVVGFHFDAPAVAREVVPVEQHRPQRRQQRIRNARAPASLWSRPSGSTQPSTETPVRSTSMGCVVRGQQFQRLLHRRGQTAQGRRRCFVRGQFRRIGQLAVHQQVRHFLELAVRGQVGDVVAAIVQIVAAVAHRADGRVARRRAGERHRLFGFEGRGRVAVS